MSNRAKETADLGEDVQLQELDERHYVAVNVFERRHQRGWSQEKLAEEADMTQAQIARLEAGQANPTLRTLTKLAHSLGESVYALATPPEIGVDFGITWEIETRVSESLFGGALPLKPSERAVRGDLIWRGGSGVVITEKGYAGVEAERSQRQTSETAA